MNPQLLTAVRATPFFEGLSPDRATRAASAFRLRDYERGEIVSGVADLEPCAYVVVSGLARAVRVNTDGRCLTSGLLGPGMVFGRLPFALDESTEQVEAVVESTVLCVATGDLEALASVDPLIARSLAQSSAERLRAAESRLAALAFQPVPARLAGVLLELADHFGKVTPSGVRLDVRLTHGTLAEMTGTTRETLTKVAGWLRSENICSIERRAIWVMDWDGLEAVQRGERCMPGRTTRV